MMNRVTMTGLEQGVVHFPARVESLVYDDMRFLNEKSPGNVLTLPCIQTLYAFIDG